MLRSRKAIIAVIAGMALLVPMGVCGWVGDAYAAVAGGREIRGQVTDAVSGRGVGAVVLTAEGYDKIRGRTGRDGTFSMAGVCAPFVMRLTRDGYQTARVTIPNSKPGAPYVVRITLQPIVAD